MDSPPLLLHHVKAAPRGGSLTDDVWKWACVVGVALAAYHLFGPQVVTAHGVGSVSWVTLAAVAVFTAATSSVLGRTLLPLAYIAMALLALALVCTFGLVAFIFMFGGPERASEIGLRAVQVMDKILRLLPG